MSEQLLDQLHIERVVTRLGRCLDDRDFDGLRALFTSDARVVTPGGVAVGHDDLVAQARRRHTDPVGIQHLITNVLVDWVGDPDSERSRARVRANLLVTFADTGVRDPHPFQLGEVYEFDVVREPRGDWRFSEMRSRPVWSRDLPPSLAASVSH